MSLRGEQDDLNWYDIYGPNVPYAELEKEYEYATKPQVSSAENMPEEGKYLTGESMEDFLPVVDTCVQDQLAVDKVEVVEVTVDGRFGHANHSHNEPAESGVGKDISRGDIKVEGLVESADAI